MLSMITSETEKSYNEIPYSSKSFERTQPFYLKNTMALLGFETVDIRKARILEIGCSFGGNIIPIAINYPNTEIYGIDLSKVQVEKGNEIIEYIGLKNIKLLNQDILNFKNDLGKFDYIICHGVFSWVPEVVKDKILDIIKQNLSDNGVALVSYNTYPGWSKYDVYRNLMKFRVDFLRKKGFEISDMEKLSYGKGALEFLEKYSHLPKEFKDDIKLVLDKEDYYLLHEYYEEHNKPLYLYEFNNELLKKDLFHICDANLNLTFKYKEKDEALNLIEEECKSDLVAKEQYYDYIYNTQFRSSIITHTKNRDKINLTEVFNKKDFENLYISGYFLKKDEGFLMNNKVVNIKNEKLGNLLEYLTSIYPENISIKDTVDKFGDELVSDILYLIILNSMEVFPYHINKKGEELKLNPIILKYMKKCFEESNAIKVSNYRGQICEIDDYFIEILNKIDENTTYEKLEKDIMKMFENGDLVINSEDKNYELVVKKVINEIKNFLNLFLI